MLLPRFVRPSFDKITLGLIAMILFAFAVGAYRMDKQARDIQQIVDAQSRFVFEFNVPDRNTGENTTAIITCIKVNSKYACVTQQPNR